METTVPAWNNRNTTLNYKAQNYPSSNFDHGYIDGLGKNAIEYAGEGILMNLKNAEQRKQ